MGSSLSRLSCLVGVQICQSLGKATHSGLLLERPSSRVRECLMAAGVQPLLHRFRCWCPKHLLPGGLKFRSSGLCNSVKAERSLEKKQCCPVSPNPRLFSSLSSGQTVNSPPELSPGWLVIVPKQGPKQDSRAAVQVRSRPPQCLRCENVPKKQKSSPRKSNLFTPWSLSY